VLASLLASLVGCGGDGDGDGDASATSSQSTVNDASDASGDSEGVGESDESGDSEGDDTTTEAPLPDGLPCGTEFSYGGRVGCETVVEGLDVKFFPLAQGQRVRRLAVYLHGDGAAEYTDNWAFSPEIFAWTDARDTMVVAVLSPAFYDDGTVAFGAAQPEHAELVATTVEAFLDAWEPEHADQTLWWATSGGSWFFSSSFVAVAGERLPGVYVANCGGAGFSFGWAWDPMTNTAARDLVPLYFNYGTEDFLAPGIIDSIAEYEGLGFEVDALVHEGAMHCAHPIDGPTLDFWSRHVE
jgi:hypothetical protein